MGDSLCNGRDSWRDFTKGGTGEGVAFTKGRIRVCHFDRVMSLQPKGEISDNGPWAAPSEESRHAKGFLCVRETVRYIIMYETD